MIHKIEVYVKTNKAGSVCTDILEVKINDNATEKDIENIKEAVAEQWMNEAIEWGWKNIE